MMAAPQEGTAGRRQHRRRASERQPALTPHERAAGARADVNARPLRSLLSRPRAEPVGERAVNAVRATALPVQSSPWGRGQEGAAEAPSHSRAPALPGQSRSGGSAGEGGRGRPLSHSRAPAFPAQPCPMANVPEGPSRPLPIALVQRSPSRGTLSRVRRARGAGIRCGVPARSGAGTLRVKPRRRHHATPASEAPGSAHSLRDHRRSAAHAPRRGYRDGALHAR